MLPTKFRAWTCHLSILACLSAFSLTGCDFIKEQWYEKTGDCEGLAKHYVLVNEDCQVSCAEDNENRPAAIRECRKRCPDGWKQLEKVTECAEAAMKKREQEAREQNNQQSNPGQNAPQQRAPNNNAPNNYRR